MPKAAKVSRADTLSGSLSGLSGADRTDKGGDLSPLSGVRPSAGGRERKEAKNGRGRSTGGHPLVRKWFHSYEDDRRDVLRWQGQVLASVSPELFLVQLYEWFGGAPSNQRLVPVSAMVTWTFYETDEQMRDASERQHGWQEARRTREDERLQ